MYLIEEETSPAELTKFLRKKGWLQSSQENVLSIEKPGEGNMNVVLRLKTNERSLILKQSRPFVRKYPEIMAPLDRIHVEYKFYKAIQDSEIVEFAPGVIAFDPEEYLMILEDIGENQDMSQLYQTRSIEVRDLEKLVFFLTVLHQLRPTNYPSNSELRQLNHQHIFVLPFLEDNGFQLNDVQEGLQELSLPYKSDQLLRQEIRKLGALYLTTGKTLIHGDFYPGSWMKTANDLYILDPEFSFLGFPEFDLGVMTAHMIMSTMDDDCIAIITKKYGRTIDESLMVKVAGTEIMRRLIGLAQLPLSRSLTEKELLLRLAYKMILS